MSAGCPCSSSTALRCSERAALVVGAARRLRVYQPPPGGVAGPAEAAELGAALLVVVAAGVAGGGEDALASPQPTERAAPESAMKRTMAEARTLLMATQITT